MVDAYTKAGAKVRALTKAEFDAWIDLAKKTSWPEFVAKSADAKQLLELITAVK
jgi:hypothetical protein